MDRRLIFDKDQGSRSNQYFFSSGVDSAQPNQIFPKEFLREDISLPSLGELGVIRHYLNLASLNFSVDSNFYPLGSCTMKYNPKINEQLAQLSGFKDIHPYQDNESVQGALELIYKLEQVLIKITGMKRFSFQPASGAQGELTGMLMIRKYHQSKGLKKTKVIVPDSAHGTNPATATMCGYEIVTVESTPQGSINLDQLRSLVDDQVAAIMLTNPNTLGLFEEDILEISQILHAQGAFLYYDGANFNPLLGITNPALMGFDVIHLNFHKTFSTPHGCGGPGSGAVGASEALKEFLPQPLVEKKDDKYYLDQEAKNSIGRVRSFYGNFSVLVRAYAYILQLGRNGLLEVAKNSILNANYLKSKLSRYFQVAYPKACMHEVVFSCQRQKEKGALSLDIAKRLIDFGIHPPTMYFPLIVNEALMVEPTETESKATLDYFIETLIRIDREIDQDLEKIKASPHTTPVKRVNEVQAARSLDLRWQKPGA